MNSDAELAKLQAECARLDVDNAKKRQSLYASLDELEETIANFPTYMHVQVEAMAARPQRYTATEFFRYLRSWLASHKKKITATVLMAAFAIYMQLWYSNKEAPRGPRAGGPFMFYASADGRGSVVDEVFASAACARAQGQRVR
jgi:hypothetical protein